MAAGHYPHRGIELLGGQRDHQVATVVAGNRKNALRAGDVGGLEQIVVTGIAMR